jgi:hypothetical protein
LWVAASLPTQGGGSFDLGLEVVWGCVVGVLILVA